MDKNIEMAHTVAQAVASHGGQTYYVGGFVRDRLMGIDNKDVDIEVHGITPETLAEILDSLGERVTMGASFGVYGLKHYDLDIAMPRSERTTGHGHRDFEVSVDPFLGVEKAAQRRDFTINSLMENVLTGEIVDSFGGREDLKNGILRFVSPETFIEDPLRALRAAQFASRFEFAVDKRTVKLCSIMEIQYLPFERITGELEKALIKAKKPSIFFEVLKEMELLDYWFSEISALSADARAHTMAVLDRAASVRAEAKSPFFFMLAALCTDIGQPEALIDRLSNEKELRDYVLNMKELADVPDSSCPDWNFLFDKSVCPADLLLLSKALREGENARLEKKQKEKLFEYEELMKRPQVMGRDLIAAGLKPDRSFSSLLAYAHELHLRGVEKDEALKMTLKKAEELSDFNIM